MKLSQTVLPPPVDDNPYDRWRGIFAGLLAQDLEGASRRFDPDEIAVVVVQAFFGAYMIADELGRLDGLHDDVARLWRMVRSSLSE
jgi:hypothetical protein